MARPIFKNIDEYVASFPESTQVLLTKLRNEIKNAGPELTEGISYGIPTFYLNGKYLVYFAGFKNHVSIYPATTSAVDKAGLNSYKVSKGTLQFPLDKPIPFKKITIFVHERINERI